MNSATNRTERANAESIVRQVKETAAAMLPSDQVSSATCVVLFAVDHEAETEEWRGTLAEFITANELDTYQIAELQRNLNARREHPFGGGAEALTILRVASDVAREVA